MTFGLVALWRRGKKAVVKTATEVRLVLSCLLYDSRRAERESSEGLKTRIPALLISTSAFD